MFGRTTALLFALALFLGTTQIASAHVVLDLDPGWPAPVVKVPPTLTG